MPGHWIVFELKMLAHAIQSVNDWWRADERFSLAWAIREDPAPRFSSGVEQTHCYFEKGAKKWFGTVYKAFRQCLLVA